MSEKNETDHIQLQDKFMRLWIRKPDTQDIYINISLWKIPGWFYPQLNFNVLRENLSKIDLNKKIAYLEGLFHPGNPRIASARVKIGFKFKKSNWEIENKEVLEDFEINKQNINQDEQAFLSLSDLIVDGL